GRRALAGRGAPPSRAPRPRAPTGPLSRAAPLLAVRGRHAVPEDGRSHPMSPRPRTRRLKLVEPTQKATQETPVDHPARWSRSGARTIAIASGKGGVGKSNLAANLAVALGERGARVLLVDADLAQASLDLLLGLHPRFDLQHVLAGDRTLEDIV